MNSTQLLAYQSKIFSLKPEDETVMMLSAVWQHLCASGPVNIQLFCVESCMHHMLSFIHFHCIVVCFSTLFAPLVAKPQCQVCPKTPPASNGILVSVYTLYHKNNVGCEMWFSLTLLMICFSMSSVLGVLSSCMAANRGQILSEAEAKSLAVLWTDISINMVVSRGQILSEAEAKSLAVLWTDISINMVVSRGQILLETEAKSLKVLWTDISTNMVVSRGQILLGGWGKVLGNPLNRHQHEHGGKQRPNCVGGWGKVLGSPLNRHQH